MVKKISRRIFLRGAGLTAVGALVAACTPTTPESTQAPQVVKETQVVMQTQVVKETVEKQVTKVVEVTAIPKTGPKNALGIALPEDALPLEQQIWEMALPDVGTQISGATGHEMESLYSKAFFHGLGSEPLTRLDKEGNVVGVSCESWKQSDDGLSWDFKLRKELVFSDGAPCTAKDWVWTFQHSFGKGYDFGWMFADILNSSDVLAGKKPPEELGLEAVDDYTLRVKTATATPYIPAVMTWAYLAPKQAYDQYGDNWSVEPDHFITNGAWLLTEFERGVGWAFKLNPKYKGVAKPYMTELRAKKMPVDLNAYISGQNPSYTLNESSPVGEIGMVNANPVLRAESHPQFASVTWYLGFHTLGTFKELTDKKVRLALNKALDKTAMVGALGRGFAYPAWGILPKGFIGNSYDALAKEDPNVFDIAAAKQLLADAGFPDGKGFPEFELWIRSPTPYFTASCEAIQASWLKNLGINVKLVPADHPTFTKAVFTDKSVPIYFVGYSLDYWDPVTFLNVFRTGSRHPWESKDFDDAVTTANAQPDAAKRLTGLGAAEKILVQDAGFVFWSCNFAIALWPCNIAGGWTTPNSLGYSAVSTSPYAGGPNEYDDFYYNNSNCRAGLK
jgi:peptide/nickel transport system substrate-binding protein/oligopeptide transport system substrate-binding protein